MSAVLLCCAKEVFGAFWLKIFDVCPVFSCRGILQCTLSLTWAWDGAGYLRHSTPRNTKIGMLPATPLEPMLSQVFSFSGVDGDATTRVGAAIIVFLSEFELA